MRSSCTLRLSAKSTFGKSVSERDLSHLPGLAGGLRVQRSNLSARPWNVRTSSDRQNPSAALSLSPSLCPSLSLSLSLPLSHSHSFPRALSRSHTWALRAPSSLAESARSASRRVCLSLTLSHSRCLALAESLAPARAYLSAPGTELLREAPRHLLDVAACERTPRYRNAHETTAASRCTSRGGHARSTRWAVWDTQSPWSHSR